VCGLYLASYFNRPIFQPQATQPYPPPQQKIRKSSKMASAPIKLTPSVQIPPLFQWSPRGQHLRKRRRRSVKRSTSFYIEGVKTGPTKPNLFQNIADDPSFQQSLTFPSLFPFSKFLPSFIHSKFFKTSVTTCYNFSFSYYC